MTVKITIEVYSDEAGDEEWKALLDAHMANVKVGIPGEYLIHKVDRTYGRDDGIATTFHLSRLFK